MKAGQGLGLGLRSCLAASAVCALHCSTSIALRLGCEAADIFAAVAGVAGPVSVSCSPSRPITVVYFHGTADTDFKMNPMMWAYFNRHPLP
jgi:poly(3-hydroxybutyrate) depolymerase